MIRVGQRAFERLVADALDSLPDAILRMLDNVAVVVADTPTEHQRKRTHLRDDEDLLGLYEGIPLTERTAGYGAVLPDKVTIFQRAIEAQCDSEAELVAEVRHTVVHELAHHLGISDARLIELGFEDDPDWGGR
ncbi:MAG: metallopeptidase family protein [Chloroflexota bacterium]|nr:metallopeptidase family protein [Chloroflexota bacterium]MDQ6907940.1 metallopeptidase family protein [Chloroflexota bacterium]